MRKKFAVLLAALICVCACAGAQTFTSEKGYSLEIPDGWVRLSEENFPTLVEALGEEALAEAGISADQLGQVLLGFEMAGMENFFGLDESDQSLTVQATEQALTREELEQAVETSAQIYQSMGYTDVLSGWAQFDIREFALYVFTLEGHSVATYMYSEGGMCYTFVFTAVPAEDVARMLNSLQITGAAFAGEADGDAAQTAFEGQ